MTEATAEGTRLQTLTPYLCVKGADAAIAFYESVFGARLEGEAWRVPTDARVGHAELHVGGIRFFLSDEYADLDVLSPLSRGGTTVAFVLLVDDVETAWRRALDAGATVEREVVEDHGMRSGWLRDPWGHRWNVGELLPESS